MGTGAFTSVSADRSVNVEVADDADALLAITPEDTPNGNEYVSTSGGTVSLDFTDTDSGATGINDEATTIIDDLLVIENQGTQGVYVGYTHPASPTGNFALYHEDPSYRGDHGGKNYNAPTTGNDGQLVENDGQLNINTAPDNDGDGEPDLVYLEPGDALTNIGLFFFGSPDASAISSDPITFHAAASFDAL